MPAPTRLFVAAAPGVEPVVEHELRALSAVPSPFPQRIHDLRTVEGGVECDGDAALLLAANLHLRCASRILLRCGEVTARDFATLQRRVADLPWDGFARRGQPLRVAVHATAHRCRLYHTGALAEAVLAALTTRGFQVQALDTGADGGLGDDGSAGAANDRPAAHDLGAAPAGESADLAVWLRGSGDRFTVSIDTSGALLHRRGWRTEEGAAPLRETLAAALCLLVGYRGDVPFCDPMCGAGTLVIEAALQALRRAPGLNRSFACERWPSHDPALLQALRAQAQAAERDPADVRVHAPLFGRDRDPQVLAVAQRNAERAGVAHVVRFEVADIVTARLPVGVAPGLILCNPPYGRRIGGRELGGLYRALARFARSSPGWRLGLLTASHDLARLALRRSTMVPLRNGGLRVGLYSDALSGSATPAQVLRAGA